LDRIDSQKIEQYLLAGQKMQAIKYYRDLTGSDLLASKRFIEDLENKLIEEYPEKFNLPKPSQEQYENDRIHSKEGLINTIAEVTKNYKVIDFKSIPMGWAADLIINNRKYCIYSHRGDIACCEYLDDKEVREVRLNVNTDNLTQRQEIIRYCHFPHYLTAVFSDYLTGKASDAFPDFVGLNHKFIL